MSHEEYVSKMLSLADEIGDVPENIDAINAAVMKWEYDEIHKANGLAIFPHPTWRCSWNKVYNVPDVFSDYITEKGYFDAFEVLGGETYFQHNGFQTIKYYEDREKGLRYPVVGSTDSHDSYPTSRGAHICSTIVFAPENERRAIIDAIKDFRSVAVDTISREYRLVGESRLVRYACFLVENYLPLHDELCYEEGRLMKQYVTGTAEERQEAAEWLKAISGRIDRQRKKYFDF